jgi:small subunit ribosomal protein S1
VSDENEDFAAMFEASLKPKRFDKGQTLNGVVVGFGTDVAFIDIGGKGEATIDIAELKDEDGDVEVKVGDRIQATIVSTTGGITLSRKLLRGAASARQLEDAFQSGLPVEGKVEAEVKGGYEVRIAGQRAFCPFSQIDIRRGTEPATHIGQVYQFRITEYKEGGRSLVVSRRVLLEAEQKAQEAEARKAIVPGAVLTGRVASVREFGAFIELEPGIEALAHMSTFAPTGRADAWAKQVSIGMSAPFEILTIEPDKKRIGVALALHKQDVREYQAREEAAKPAEGIGSLADKLRGALSQPKK